MLNESIQALRKSKGLSQKELALKLNVVRQTVHRVCVTFFRIQKSLFKVDVFQIRQKSRSEIAQRW